MFAEFLELLLNIVLLCALVKRLGCREPFIAPENRNLTAIALRREGSSPMDFSCQDVGNPGLNTLRILAGEISSE
jgi:hypothetical protein